MRHLPWLESLENAAAHDFVAEMSHAADFATFLINRADPSAI